MAGILKQERFQVPEHSHHKRSYLKASLRRVACALFLLGLVLPSLGIASAQQESSTQRKTDLEIQKLELEVAKLQEEVRPLPSWLTGVLGLKADARGLPSWLTGVLGLLASFLAGAATVLAARRARRGALDQAVHDKRLESYPELVKATERLRCVLPNRPSTHGTRPNRV